MEKAAELLKSTDDKTYAIAARHAFPQFPRRCRRQKLPVLRKKRNPLHFLPVRIVQQLKFQICCWGKGLIFT